MSEVLRSLFIVSTFVGASSETVCEAFRTADNIPDDAFGGHLHQIPSNDERFMEVLQSVREKESVQDMVLFHREETPSHAKCYLVVQCGIGTEKLSWKVDSWHVYGRDLISRKLKKYLGPGANGNGDFASTEKFDRDIDMWNTLGTLRPKFGYVSRQLAEKKNHQQRASKKPEQKPQASRNVAQLSSAQVQPQSRGKQNAGIMLAIGTAALAGLSMIVPGRVQKWFPRAIASTNQSEDGVAQHGVEQDGHQQDDYDGALVIGIIILVVAVIAMIGTFFFLRNKSKKRMTRKMDKVIHSRNEEVIQDAPESVIVNMDNDAVPSCPGSDDYGSGVTGEMEGADQEMEGAVQETGQYI